MNQSKRLVEMLTYARPGRSETEADFIRRFIMPYEPEKDAMGNLIVRVGDAPILWSSHTDTVHETDGRQALAFRGDFLRLASSSGSSCLGADDTVGVWIMLEMLDAMVPGLYIFHRDEECGMIGSSHIAKTTPQVLDGIQYAVAFDRREYDSIVTHQAGRQTASVSFAQNLCDFIGLGHTPDPTGIYTDTEAYAAIVPECTNVSVGYHSAHSSNEVADLVFAGWLAESMCRLTEERIAEFPVDREPTPARGWLHYTDQMPTFSRKGDWDIDDFEWSTLDYQPCFICDYVIAPHDKMYTWDREPICEECHNQIIGAVA